MNLIKNKNYFFQIYFNFWYKMNQLDHLFEKNIKNSNLKKWIWRKKRFCLRDDCSDCLFLITLLKKLKFCEQNWSDTVLYRIKFILYSIINIKWTLKTLLFSLFYIIIFISQPRLANLLFAAIKTLESFESDTKTFPLFIYL